MFWTKLKLWFDRAISSNGIRQWIIPALSFGTSLIIFSIILLIVNRGWCLLGDTYNATDSFEPDNVLDAAFYHMFTNGGQNLFSSHLWGAVITIIGIIVIAVLTSSITNFFEQRAKQYLSGETSYYFKNHIIIFGTSDVLYSIIDQTLKNDSSRASYILVQTCKDVEKIRREVFSFLDERFNKNRIVFSYGDRTSSSDMKRLHLDKAVEVFIIGESQESDIEESYRDSYNIDCINRIRDAFAIKSPSVEAALKERKELDSQILSTDKEFNHTLSEIGTKIGKSINEVEDEWENDKKLLMTSDDEHDRDLASKADMLQNSLKKLIQRKASIERKLNKRNKLRCNVMFEYQTTFAAFQNSDIDYSSKAYLNFEPFSFHEMWAQKVLLQIRSSDDENSVAYHYLDQYPGTDSNPRYIDEESKECVHLVIVGMSKMGVAMALEAAYLCHFPNFNKDKSRRTRITFIDEHADVEQDFFWGRFKELRQNSIWRTADADDDTEALYQSSIQSNSKDSEQPEWLDIEWEFIKGRVEQKEVQQFLIDSSNDTKFIQTIAICFPQSHMAIAASLYLPEVVYDRSLQVLVYQRLSGELLSLLAREKNASKYGSLIPFGMISEGYSTSLSDTIGPILVNSAYCGTLVNLKDNSGYYSKYNELFSSSVKGKLYKFRYLFNTEGYNRYVYKYFKTRLVSRLNKKWYLNLVSDRWSSRFNYNSIIPKLRSLKFNICDLLQQSTKYEELEALIANKTDILIQVEHNRWNTEKLLSGFRPLNDSEIEELRQYDYVNQEKEWNAKKKEFQNGRHKAHADLCDYETLLVRDPSALNYDLRLNQLIPTIIELSNELRQ